MLYLFFDFALLFKFNYLNQYISKKLKSQRRPSAVTASDETDTKFKCFKLLLILGAETQFVSFRK